MNGKDTSVRIVGTNSTVMAIFELIKGNKSIWLENEYGTHPIWIVTEDRSNMTNRLNKSKLLEALNYDVAHAKEKMRNYDIDNPREAIIHHICKDEAEYAQSITNAIENGNYDVVI